MSRDYNPTVDLSHPATTMEEQVGGVVCQEHPFQSTCLDLTFVGESNFRKLGAQKMKLHFDYSKSQAFYIKSSSEVIEK